MSHHSPTEDLPTLRTNVLGDDDLSNNNKSKLLCCRFSAELNSAGKHMYSTGDVYIIQCQVELNKGFRKQCSQKVGGWIH